MSSTKNSDKKRKLAADIPCAASPTASDSKVRVWRACRECRKKKIKCDGKEICHHCVTHSRECQYPPSNDNASANRQSIATVDHQCKVLSQLCDKVDQLANKFTVSMETLERLTTETRMLPMVDSADLDASRAFPVVVGQGEPDALAENDEEDETGSSSDSDVDETGNKFDGHMALDSYGQLRYIGGPANMILVKTIQDLTATSATEHNTNPSELLNTHPAQTPGSSSSVSISSTLPFFSQGLIWPKLPHLPSPDSLPRPPRYVSDLLVNLYFSHIHYTFPVLFQPNFMRKYQAMLDAKSSASSSARFMSVFFAVCACASSLLPRDFEKTGSFPGLEYYEKSLLLHYHCVGQGTIEQVQCLGLLSLCSAGWNTLTQSWKFAGQAVRAAQDLGLHVDLHRRPNDPVYSCQDLLIRELARRVWWSICGLDRIVSICLGRPMVVDEVDCYCPLPIDLNDEDLESYLKAGQPDINPGRTSKLTGFLVFSRLCQISARISRASRRFLPLKNRPNSKKWRKIRKRVHSLELDLKHWLQTLPDEIKFSANQMNAAPEVNLTMCTITFILHSASIINLHGPFIDAGIDYSNDTISHHSSMLCTQAASSCIQTGQLIHSHVPPSHYLAFCTHELAISGILLLRTCTDRPVPENVVSEVELCIQQLSLLETVWSGAVRSRVILQELLSVSRQDEASFEALWNIVAGSSGDILAPDFVLPEV